MNQPPLTKNEKTITLLWLAFCIQGSSLLFSIFVSTITILPWSAPIFFLAAKHKFFYVLFCLQVLVQFDLLYCGVHGNVYPHQWALPVERPVVQSAYHGTSHQNLPTSAVSE
jgi:hypothetical protein